MYIDLVILESFKTEKINFRIWTTRHPCIILNSKVYLQVFLLNGKITCVESTKIILVHTKGEIILMLFCDIKNICLFSISSCKVIALNLLIFSLKSLLLIFIAPLFLSLALLTIMIAIVVVLSRSISLSFRLLFNVVFKKERQLFLSQYRNSWKKGNYMGSNINVENTKNLAKKLRARNFAISKLDEQ